MRTYVLNTIRVGLDILELVRDRIELTGIIGLDPGTSPDPETVAGYVDMSSYAERAGLPFVGVHSYALSNPADREHLLALEVDVLVVAGWQRLVPAWLIEHCGVVIGIHGSPLGITRGRGRSPQIWALLAGFPAFDVSLFRILPGVDDGPVLETARFAYTPCDDIRTSYLKVSYLVAELLVRSVRSGRILESGTPQDAAAAEYLPQRLPDDGQIDWHRSSEDVTRFIRAQTRPYPGAFVVIEGGTLRCWRAIPFDEAAEGRHTAPGTLLALFESGDLLVRCGRGAVLVTEYTFEGDLAAWRGRCLPSDDHAARMALISARHRAKYPDLPLSKALL